MTTRLDNNEKQEISVDRPTNQAYQLLHLGFTILPILSGLDKFFNYATTWEHYLFAPFNLMGTLFQAPDLTIPMIGIIELIIGIGVWFKPYYFSYILIAWLIFSLINLSLLGQHFNIALKDYGLIFAALSLNRLTYKLPFNF